jgi:hypothetical protein
MAWGVLGVVMWLRQSEDRDGVPDANCTFQFMKVFLNVLRRELKTIRGSGMEYPAKGLCLGGYHVRSVRNAVTVHGRAAVFFSGCF